MILHTQDRGMKPAPQVSVRGRVGPPLGTLGEQIRRALEPEPTPHSFDLRRKFLRTCEVCPQFRRDFAALIWPDIAPYVEWPDHD